MTINEPQPEEEQSEAEHNLLTDILEFTAHAASVVAGHHDPEGEPDEEERITEKDLDDPEVLAAVQELADEYSWTSEGADQTENAKEGPAEAPLPIVSIIVIGSVNFSSDEVVFGVLGAWLDRHPQFQVILATSGANRGAEAAAMRLADSRRVQTTQIRDEQIPYAQFATGFAFIEGESAGARGALALATRAGIGMTVVTIDKVVPFDAWAGR